MVTDAAAAAAQAEAEALTVTAAFAASREASESASAADHRLAGVPTGAIQGTASKRAGAVETVGSAAAATAHAARVAAEAEAANIVRRELQILPFPWRGLFRLTQEQTDERREGLEAWMQAVARLPLPPSAHAILLDFFEVGLHDVWESGGQGGVQQGPQHASQPKQPEPKAAQLVEKS